MRDRPELLAIAELVRSIGEKGRLELLEQLCHHRAQQWIHHVGAPKKMLQRVAQHFCAQQLVAAEEADPAVGGLLFPVVPAAAKRDFAVVEKKSVGSTGPTNIMSSLKYKKGSANPSICQHADGVRQRSAATARAPRKISR